MNMSNHSQIKAFAYKGAMVAALTSLLSGCATTPRQSYVGDPLPVDQIARITMEEKKLTFWQKMNTPQYQINSLVATHVDQQKLGSFWGARGEHFRVVDVTPGEHTITVLLSGNAPSLLAAGIQSSVENKPGHVASGYGMILKFNAQAGHHYIVKYVEKRLPLIAWIEDAATGETAGGEKPDPAK